MSAIDFPANPTTGQEFTAAGLTWQWDGTAWRLTGGGGTFPPVGSLIASGEWGLRGSATTPAPGLMRSFAINNVLIQQWLEMAALDANGVDFTAVYSSLKAGDTITMRSLADPSIATTYVVATVENPSGFTTQVSARIRVAMGRVTGFPGPWAVGDQCAVEFSVGAPSPDMTGPIPTMSISGSGTYAKTAAAVRSFFTADTRWISNRPDIFRRLSASAVRVVPGRYTVTMATVITPNSATGPQPWNTRLDLNARAMPEGQAPVANGGVAVAAVGATAGAHRTSAVAITDQWLTSEPVDVFWQAFDSNAADALLWSYAATMTMQRISD